MVVNSVRLAAAMVVSAIFAQPVIPTAKVRLKPTSPDGFAMLAGYYSWKDYRDYIIWYQKLRYD